MKIKGMLFLSGFCLISAQAMAQTMNAGSEFQNGNNLSIDAQIEKARPSIKYVNTLKTCYPYSEEYNVTNGNEKINVKFEVLGLGKTKACRLVNTIKSKDGYYITRCSLKPDQLKQYASAMTSLYARHNSSFPKDPNEEDYDDLKTISSIKNEKNTCFTKVEYDETKELRENLANCTPYMKRFRVDDYGMEYRIKEPVEDRCLFVYSMLRKVKQLPGITQSAKNKMLGPDVPRDTIATYTCLLTKFNIEELILAFEKLKIITNELRDATDTPPAEALGKVLKKLEDDKICVMTDLRQ